MEENQFMITPSEVNIEHLYEFLINNLSFKNVLELYLLLKDKIQQPTARVIKEHYKIDCEESDK